MKTIFKYLCLIATFIMLSFSLSYALEFDLDTDGYIDIDYMPLDELWTFQEGVTVSTGKHVTVGTTQWDDGSDKIEGNIIADDSIDDDAIDFTDLTLLDFGLAITHDTAAELDALYEAELNNSAGLLSALSDETGTGVAVFGTTPTFTTSIILGTTTIDETEIGILDGLTGVTGSDVSVVTGTAGTSTYHAVWNADGDLVGGLAPLAITHDTSGELDALYEAELDNSAGLLAALSDETGTGVAVFGTAPTFTTSITMGSAELSEAELEILDGATLSTTQINYLANATGTTGTSTTNLVFSASPTFTGTETHAADSIAHTSIYSGTTSLDETTAADDSGASIIGVFDEFDNSSASNVQDVLDDLDAAIVASGSGDVTAAGDCASGECLDGSVDGGTSITLYDAQGATTLSVGDNAAAVALTLPIVTGTLLTADGVGTSLTALNGENIQDDTIDDDSIDFDDVTLLDFGLAITHDTADELDALYEAELNDSAGLLAALDDETGTGVAVFGTAPTFTTGITITGANADPDAAGNIRYDTTVTGLADGALAWYDQDEIRYIVDLDTLPVTNGYFISYNATDDKFEMTAPTLTATDFALTADADAGDKDIKSINGLYGVDDAVYIDMGTDGYLDIEADTLIRLLGPTTSTGSYDATISTTVAGGETGIFSYPTHITNALTGELIAVRGSARVDAIDSAAGTVMGGKFQSGNMGTGTDLLTATGVYSEVVNKIPSGATTWTNAIAFEANLDLNQGSAGNVNTITNAYLFYGNYNLPTTDLYSTVTNGYGIFVRNEAVGGTGQMLDAAFYADDLNHNSGVYGWDFGLDFSGITSGILEDDCPRVIGQPEYLWEPARPKHGKVIITVESVDSEAP